MYRIPQDTDEEVAEKALLMYGQEKQMRKDLRKALTSFFLSLNIPAISSVKLSAEIRSALASLSSFIVKARSGLVRDRYRRDLIYIPQPEAPARLAKQLGTLVKALAVVEGQKEVTWDNYYLALKAALDAVPGNRMRHLLALCNEEFTLTTSKVAEKTEYSPSGSNILLEDLTALKITSVERGGSGVANQWRISDISYSYFKKILPKNSDNLYKVFSKGSIYHPLISEMLSGKAAQVGESDEISVDDIPF